jgi:hypothetical protein
LRVVDEALDQLSLAEGRVNAFADVSVASAGRLADGLLSTLEDSLESLDGVDEDAEAARLDHYDSLVSNTVSAMAILRQFQASMVELLRTFGAQGTW